MMNTIHTVALDLNDPIINHILLTVFPPHSTHRLQPLDVRLFSPLTTYYSQVINKLLSES
jgi:DDE superfamily endonuclease